MMSLFPEDEVIRIQEGSVVSGIILCMHSANERRRYIVTSPLIGWVHTQKDPWVLHKDIYFLLQFVYDSETVVTELY